MCFVCCRNDSHDAWLSLILTRRVGACMHVLLSEVSVNYTYASTAIQKVGFFCADGLLCCCELRYLFNTRLSRLLSNLLFA